MDKYRAMILKRCEDTARTIAYSIFKAKNDAVTKEKLNYQLETYLRDEEGNFIHPNAVRYFLYQSFELLKAEKKIIDKKLRDAEKFFEDFKNTFDDPKTEDEEGIDQLAERRISVANRLGKMTGDQQDMKQSFLTYMKKADEYRVNGILAAVLAEGIDYVNSLCDAFQSFYMSFESKINNINRRINICLTIKYIILYIKSNNSITTSPRIISISNRISLTIDAMGLSTPATNIRLTTFTLRVSIAELLRFTKLRPLL
jgi:hypothetical protein